MASLFGLVGSHGMPDCFALEFPLRGIDRLHWGRLPKLCRLLKDLAEGASEMLRQVWHFVLPSQ